MTTTDPDLAPTEAAPAAHRPAPRRGPLARLRSAVLRRAARLARTLGGWDPFAFANLTVRIVIVNVAALAVLVGGVMILEQYRESLIDIRVKGLRIQAQMIAEQLREKATDPAPVRLDAQSASEALASIFLPDGLRAQVYDHRGRLIADSRTLGRFSQRVEKKLLPDGMPRDGLLGRLDDMLLRLTRFFSEPKDLYREASPSSISRDPSVYAALRGGDGDVVSVNSEGELILTVTTPVRRVKYVRGAVALSTDGGEIDRIVDKERRDFLHVLAVAVFVSLCVAAILALQIARPIRLLARAADAGGATLNPERIQIPDLTKRGDEIGNLSASLRRMTAALSARISATERFAADVAHEIKNPLTSLRSAVETLPLARTEAQRERLVAVIAHDVRRLDRLVTDISNASRLDAELVREERAPVDLKKLIEGVASMSENAAAARRASIVFEAPDRFDATVRGLEGRLAQVFQNLIDNAISFSPEGGSVVVRFSAIEAERGPAVRVAVLDQGPGVPPEALEKIFQRFYTQRPDEDFGEHSGLGLNIARQIVEAHGGRIYAGNRREGGAVFTVELLR